MLRRELSDKRFAREGSTLPTAEYTPNNLFRSVFVARFVEMMTSTLWLAFSSLPLGVDTVLAAVSQINPRSLVCVLQCVNFLSLMVVGPSTIVIACRSAMLAS